MRIRRATAGDLTVWLSLRRALWPDDPNADQPNEVRAMIDDTDKTWIAYLALAENGSAVGFAEASLRSDPVNGCDSSPVAFLEGIYVAPAHRLKGVARALVVAVEVWARSREVTEFASDAFADNTASHAMHQALGFAETERVVYFRKPLNRK